MKIQSRTARVHNFLRRNLKPPWARFSSVHDPRDPRGLRWPLPLVLQTVLGGLLSGYKTLREVEDHSQELLLPGHSPLPRRLSDTTMYDLLGELSPESLRQTLVQQVRTLWRSKSLGPVGLPCGVVAIDGKAVGTLDHHAHGWGQLNHRDHDGTPYWLVRVLRGVLTSSPGKTTIMQLPIPAHTNEMGTFPAMFGQLMHDYGAGDLFGLITVDAGMTCKAHAALVDAAHKGYVMAVKENQPELHVELLRLLQPQLGGAPLFQGPWEREKGHQVQRRLYRTVEIAGYPDWESARQGWLVRNVRRYSDGREEADDRYFLTNVPVGLLNPSQIVLVVRGHWGIENDSNWTLDMIFGEDDTPMCTQGTATLALGVLRLLAYNLLQLARRRHLQPKPRAPAWENHDLLPWRSLLRAFQRALSPETPLAVPVT